MTDLCFILDVNIAWVGRALERRGFIVYMPRRDYPLEASDSQLLEYAISKNCIIVSTDKFFEDMPNSLYIPHKWLKRYNSWEIVTKIIKYASIKSRKRD